MRLENLLSPGTITTSQALRVSCLKAINFVQVVSTVTGWTSHAVQLSAFFAACKVETDKLIRVAVTAITVTGAGSTARGSTRQLGITTTPANASDKRATWVSANPAIVSVDPTTGLCTVIGVGAVVITATSTDAAVSGTATVTGT
jgi:uncharacterized protein YjdB